MSPGPNRFKTGSFVPETGVYRVVHTAHRLPAETVILQGECFPRCAKCSEAVLFELAYPAPDLFRSDAYRIYELPVLEDDVPQKRSGRA